MEKERKKQNNDQKTKGKRCKKRYGDEKKNQKSRE